MDESIPMSRKARFGLWFFQNVFLPLLPLGIIATVDCFIGRPFHALDSEAILIYAIILPALYLEEDNRALRYVYWALSLFGAILFTIAHIGSHLNFATTGVYHMDAALDAFYILVASIAKGINIHSSNRQVE